MKKIIIQSNKWYDKLSDLKKDLFFIIFIFGSLIFAQVLTYVENNLWALQTWMIIWSLWRIPYILTKHKK